MTWGFPCQDISVAGRLKGIEEGTRSGLYYQGIRILKETMPKYSIIENVKNLTSKKFKEEFEMILKDLDEAGYNSYWKVLNAKNYGVPQNRERVFIISIRKDIDKGTFQFPEPFESDKRLKDILEDEVDEKYFLSEKMIQGFIANTNMNKDNKQIIDAGNLNNKGWYKSSNKVYSNEGIAPTIKENHGTVTAVMKNSYPQYRIRRLTPLECWRLMGFDDSDYKKAKEIGMSDTQLYKQAGNSIVVNVLQKILNKLLKERD